MFRNVVAGCIVLIVVWFSHGPVNMTHMKRKRSSVEGVVGSLALVFPL